MRFLRNQSPISALQRRVSCEPDFYTDYFAFPSVCFFDLAAPTGAPIYTKSPGEVSAWGAVGRTSCETDPPATGSRSPVANVGHSRITLPDDVAFRGSPKTRFRMAV
jgi:hypothetical protein